MKFTVIHIIVSVCIILICSPPLGGIDPKTWASDFDTINLHIAQWTDVPSGTSTATVYTDDDVGITADNTTAAQLSYGASSTLVTEYKLSFDNVGGSTGNDTPAWESYDIFLDPNLGGTQTTITHQVGDDYVDVTLHVRAKAHPNEPPPDAGDYTAAQTLTIHWPP